MSQISLTGFIKQWRAKHLGPKLEINKELAVSTSHLTDHSSKFLTTEVAKAWAASIVIDEYDHGWRVLITGDPELFDEQMEEIRGSEHPELAALMELAQKHDCKWLLFDCDGPEVEGYPTYKWDMTQ